MRSAFSAESRARLRISVETTTNPLPNSPARAASTEPLTASMFVWMVTVTMVSTILSIRRDTNSRFLTFLMLLLVESTDSFTPRIRSSTDFLFSTRRFFTPAIFSFPNCGALSGDFQPLLDLIDGRGGLFAGGGRGASARPDLFDRGHDLAGGPVDLLNAGGKLLGAGGDILGALGDVGGVFEVFGDFGETLRRLFAPCQRGRLLVDRLGNFLRRGGLFLGSCGDVPPTPSAPCCEATFDCWAPRGDLLQPGDKPRSCRPRTRSS